MEGPFYCFPPNQDGIVKFALHHRGWTNDQSSLSDKNAIVSVPRPGYFNGKLGENISRGAIRELRRELRRVYPELGDKPFTSSRMCW